LEAMDHVYSPFLVNTESQDDPVDKKQLFIDTGVYTRNRMFRVLGSSKFKKQAVLRPFNTPSSAPGGVDEKVFVDTLVCPYPSLEAMELQPKRCRLLRCEPSQLNAESLSIRHWMHLFAHRPPKVAFKVKSVLFKC
jgi:hypothetical protein